jgi:hypothetical protein
MELTQLADMTEPELRKRRLDIFKEGIVEELEDIQAKMSERSWPKIVFGKLIALSAIVPGPIPSVIRAVYNAFGNSQPAKTDSALAYAAFARRELLQ